MLNYRTRFFSYDIPIVTAHQLSDNEIFWTAANVFRDDAIYQWVEDNNISLQYDVDNLTLSWFKRVTFYADLTEVQYISYTLSFYNQPEN